MVTGSKRKYQTLHCSLILNKSHLRPTFYLQRYLLPIFHHKTLNSVWSLLIQHKKTDALTELYFVFYNKTIMPSRLASLTQRFIFQVCACLIINRKIHFVINNMRVVSFTLFFSSTDTFYSPVNI